MYNTNQSREGLSVQHKPVKRFKCKIQISQGKVFITIQISQGMVYCTIQISQGKVYITIRISQGNV